jgi:hypothetical protein
MELTFSQRSDLKECLQETLLLNKKMNDTLVGIIKCANENKIVRTDKQVIKDFDGETIYRDTIYAIIFDQDVEDKVSAVAVFENNTIGVLLCGDIDLSYFTDEELLERDEWYKIEDGMLCNNATLYALCEKIEEYL